jgi:hypothetical protein
MDLHRNPAEFAATYFPFIAFKLQPLSSCTLWAPGIPTGTQWAPAVNCTNAGQQFVFPSQIEC